MPQGYRRSRPAERPANLAPSGFRRERSCQIWQSARRSTYLLERLARHFQVAVLESSRAKTHPFLSLIAAKKGKCGPISLRGFQIVLSHRRSLPAHKRQRINVARSELIFSTPSLAKMAVSAANAAEKTAQNCQDDIALFCMELLSPRMPDSQSAKSACSRNR